MGYESIATTSRFYLQMYEGRDAEIAKRLEELQTVRTRSGV
jgi:hypothetical protein